MTTINPLEELKSIFKTIQDAGWHESHRKGNTGIGKTFEDLLDKEEDNKDLPDFYDIEIKTHDEGGVSLVTLFTKSPSNPRGANTYLREKFGKYDEFGNKILHQTISATQPTTSNVYDYSFQVSVDWENERVYIVVYDKFGELIDGHIFWTFRDMENQLKRKLKKIALVSANKKEEEGIVYYKYNSIRLITGLNIISLVEAIDQGDVKIDIRIGAYKSGKNKGKTHDHGTGFRISERNLVKYAEIIDI